MAITLLVRWPRPPLWLQAAAAGGGEAAPCCWLGLASCTAPSQACCFRCAAGHAAGPRLHGGLQLRLGALHCALLRCAAVLLCCTEILAPDCCCTEVLAGTPKCQSPPMRLVLEAAYTVRAAASDCADASPLHPACALRRWCSSTPAPRRGTATWPLLGRWPQTQSAASGRTWKVGRGQAIGHLTV